MGDEDLRRTLFSMLPEDVQRAIQHRADALGIPPVYLLRLAWHIAKGRVIWEEMITVAGARISTTTGHPPVSDRDFTREGAAKMLADAWKRAQPLLEKYTGDIYGALVRLPYDMRLEIEGVAVRRSCNPLDVLVEAWQLARDTIHSQLDESRH